MIAVFFTALARALPTAVARTWRAAWLANVAALGVTIIFWYVQPGPPLISVVRGAYLFAKTSFALLMLEGAWVAHRPGRALIPLRVRVAITLIVAIVGGLTLDTLPALGITQHGALALLFLGGAVLCVRSPRAGFAWLAAGFFLRALIAGAECAAYIVSARPVAATFLAASSSFDSGAEWLLALGCVLVISGRVQHELRESNRGLLAAQENLRTLADHDPLTGLANRRLLANVFDDVEPTGATFFFFDLNDFKQINDRYGHETGDDCLRRFANGLRESFPEDVVVRYAGDEFVVVARDVEPADVAARLQSLRERVHAQHDGPPIAFAVGWSELQAGASAEEALRAADAAMYAAKPRRARSITVH